MDDTAWGAALRDARAILAEAAVRRCGAGPFRITDHDVRLALAPGGGTTAAGDQFTWTARTARRSLGVGALRSLAEGRTRTPLEAVGARLEESALWVREGAPGVSRLDHWLAGLSPAGRAAVESEAVTWATRLWCALDWGALSGTPVIGRDHWWDSPHSALLALRGRADVRIAGAHLVVLSGPRRASVRAELALVALVEALRARPGAPGRVIGWWPDAGRLVRVEPEPAVLTLAARAVAAVVGTPTPAVRRAA
jgi:hypothetical protein